MKGEAMAKKKRKQHKPKKDLDEMIQAFLKESDKKFTEDLKSKKKYRRKGSRNNISKGEDE